MDEIVRVRAAPSSLNSANEHSAGLPIGSGGPQLQRGDCVARLFGSPLVVDNRRPAQSAGDFPRDSWETAASVQALGWSAERIAALETNVESAGSAAFMIVTRGRDRRSLGRHGPNVLDALGSQELA